MPTGDARALAALLALLLFRPSGCRTGPPLPADPVGTMLASLRGLRNSAKVLGDPELRHAATDAIDHAMIAAFGEPVRLDDDDNASVLCGLIEQAGGGTCSGRSGGLEPLAKDRPGNYHGAKQHTWYVDAIEKAHPGYPRHVVESIVASEWYHPGLTARPVWCEDGCGKQFRLARLLDNNFEAIRREVADFWEHPDAAKELSGVGGHTTQFDKAIAGNGTWIDVRLFRGRAFNRRLCEQHFRVICSIVEASPEVWTNPWSHVLLSVLLKDSWVPYHHGHTNGQLTFHLPVSMPSAGGGSSAELAVLSRGGELPDDGAQQRSLYEHPAEQIARWTEGSTLVFDDSYAHAVRYRTAGGQGTGAAAPRRDSFLRLPGGGEARVILLMRAWHPEFPPEERAAVREFVRRGGEEEPAGYELLPLPDSTLSL